MIDLHTHSVFSDGSCTPEELVEHAGAASLTALALTDHDTTAGIRRFLAAAAEFGIRGIAGVEISVESPRGTMHMLGYHVDSEDASLREKLSWVRDGRYIRNKRILDRLRELGMELSWNEVQRLAGDEVVGRPHFASALIARGFVADSREAFDRFLARGRPAYVDRQRLTAEDSIRLIRAAGGVPVLAHPFTLECSNQELERTVGALRECGLEGMEVDYPEHSPARRRFYGCLAERWGLLRTGGTDFHGELTPDISLGRGFGSLRVADDVADRLEERRDSVRASL